MGGEGKGAAAAGQRLRAASRSLAHSSIFICLHRPLPAFCSILYSPPFTVATHWAAFAVYMGVMGIAGVMDHSGVRWAVPWLYDTAGAWWQRGDTWGALDGRGQERH
jgi:hypothetical protein